MKVQSEIVNSKTEKANAQATKKAVAPLIKIKSATFSESGGGNGFIIVDKFQGNPVPTPEFVREGEKADDDKSPIGFYAAQKPVYKVEFEVKPASLESITAKCEGGIFSTNEELFEVDEEGIAKGKIEGTQIIEKKCQSGPKDKEEVKWSFSIYGMPLACKDEMKINKYYILLDKGNGDRPWKNLLKAAFDTWDIEGAESQQQLVDRLSTGISTNDLYNDNFNAETGQTSSLYITQRKYPQSNSVSIGKMVDACAAGKRKAKIICAEAAALLKYTADILGKANVDGRSVIWTEWKNVANPITGTQEKKTWKEGHAYCLFGELVQNPVPEAGGPTNKGEREYINKELKEGHAGRENFQEPEPMIFEFKE
ncbi:MAG: hypothetical protein LUE13_06645 [Akkermansiaceae bacterium]|nr:hypothetical protein [Akkermansiaceae bacterium]